MTKAAGTRPDIQAIAQRAHEIYEARGGQHGDAMNDWLQAERELTAEADAKPKARAKAGATPAGTAAAKRTVRSRKKPVA